MSRGERTPTGLMDLPSTVQNLAAQRRAGILVVGEGAAARRLRFANGCITAVSGGGDAGFAPALGWAGVLRPEALLALPPAEDPAALVDGMLARGEATVDGLLDAIDCWIEEEFTVLAGWSDPPLRFAADDPGDRWAATQIRLGVSIAPGSLLLESLRRQDELGTVSPLIPDPWDVLVREPVQPGELDADQALLLAAVDGPGSPARKLLRHPQLPPFRAAMAVVALRRAGLLRIATGEEVVVRADHAFAAGDAATARGLYQRAVALGQDAPRIRLHLGELAERAGDAAEAATHFHAAAKGLDDPSARVVALRSALRLGSDPEPALLGLAAICRELGDRDEHVAILLQLAGLHESRAAYEQAAQAVGEAMELGGDPVACAMALARLAERQDDRAEMAIQLELAARSARERGRDEEAIAAWRRLLDADPGLTEPARGLAQVLAARGQRAEALRVLRAALAAVPDPNAAQLASLHELITRLDPNDAAARDWLARANLKQQNRDGAIQQLVLKAEALERSGDLNGLVRTFESIVEIEPRIEHLVRLAELRLRLGQERVASLRWCQAVDLAAKGDDLARAREIAIGGLAKLPAALPLRLRLAQVASRTGDRALALTCLRAAANLAIGMGDNDTARNVLIQICKLRQDDLITRIRLAGILEGGDARSLDLVLKDVVRCAVHTNNQGMALEYARRRVAMAPQPAFQARDELVALLNRYGDEGAELIEGRRLLDDLLVHGEIDRATDLLSRLVASQPKNADLVLQLAELHDGQGHARLAARFYRHAVPLLQVEHRMQDALAALGAVERLSGPEPGLILARSRIERGIAIDWQKIRLEFDHQERLRRVQEIDAGGGGSARAGTTSRIRPRPDLGRQRQD